MYVFKACSKRVWVEREDVGSTNVVYISYVSGVRKKSKNRRAKRREKNRRNISWIKAISRFSSNITYVCTYMS